LKSTDWVETTDNGTESWINYSKKEQITTKNSGLQFCIDFGIGVKTTLDYSYAKSCFDLIK